VLNDASEVKKKRILDQILGDPRDRETNTCTNLGVVLTISQNFPLILVKMLPSVGFVIGAQTT
jgi:hypothetical protein